MLQIEHLMKKSLTSSPAIIQDRYIHRIIFVRVQAEIIMPADQRAANSEI